ncbi:ABC transporter permease subunit [Rhodobacteraceae bacterium NNCM2]|nr:ABC transporter permease subunit [Coraliihabitans acroporae]
MSCAETFQSYAFRAIGFGERLLPKTDITLCEQIVLIGSGMMWNIYFATLAIIFGFTFATFVALARASSNPWLSSVAAGFIYLFRGTPLFIQFFFTYELVVLLPKASIDIPLIFTTITAETRWLTKAWLGALIVIILNTTAYSAQIFYGALMAVPRGEIEAAEAIGMNARQRFVRVVWPTMLRLAWPSYTNEAIFLFHATTLVFFSSFPAWRQQGDALYYANYFAENTFNPFVAYPIVATYFILATLVLIGLFGIVQRRLNRHLAPEARSRFRFKPQYIR